MSSAHDFCKQIGPRSGPTKRQDPNCLALWWYSWNNFSKPLSLNKSADDKKHAKLPRRERVKTCITGNVPWFLSSAVFLLKIKPLQNITSGVSQPSEFQTVWVQIKLDISSGMILIYLTVCKGYQTINVITSRLRVAWNVWICNWSPFWLLKSRWSRCFNGFSYPRFVAPSVIDAEVQKRKGSPLK